MKERGCYVEYKNRKIQKWKCIRMQEYKIMKMPQSKKKKKNEKCKMQSNQVLESGRQNVSTALEKKRWKKVDSFL